MKFGKSAEIDFLTFDQLLLAPPPRLSERRAYIADAMIFIFSAVDKVHPELRASLNQGRFRLVRSRTRISVARRFLRTSISVCIHQRQHPSEHAFDITRTRESAARMLLVFVHIL